ncbi:DUF4321 domain-containing protein [Natranaerofaba carboxydovora]|uniref:DUF4321 domain-containing protein n=1 Tax=Natranaerofaba carboxydovora TaxID=2742683 RepID=UPI001F12D88F|nr:DUF4321 domain-containing protein [Natranaerofaba carboxydovora]UMZ72863.1 hypothetical protein ACONDI_00400 [Natranaerofaba carboxydovora]
MKGKYNLLFLIVVLAVGALLGNLLGTLLSDQIPIMSISQSLGIDPPMHLDLSFFELKLGFMFNINLAGLLGLIISLWIFSRF